MKHCFYVDDCLKNDLYCVTYIGAFYNVVITHTEIITIFSPASSYY